MNPLVSVIIPTYKRSDMLPRAINSVLKQTYENVQVVVVDDNDSNSEYRRCTEKQMSFYANDKRVKYIRHCKNSNGAVARNTGIKNADGEIITFLDDDDVYQTDKIKKQVSRKAKKIKKSLSRKKVSLKTRFFFRIFKMSQKNGWNKTDVDYWKEKGWLNGKKPY